MISYGILTMHPDTTNHIKVLNDALSWSIVNLQSDKVAIILSNINYIINVKYMLKIVENPQYINIEQLLLTDIEQKILFGTYK